MISNSAGGKSPLEQAIEHTPTEFFDENGGPGGVRLKNGLTEFIDENGGGPGVRLRTRQQKKSP
jgi:hypothetical protein